MRVVDNQLALLALCRIKGMDWHLLAREAQRPGGLDRLLSGVTTEATEPAATASELIREALDGLPALRDAAAAEVDRASSAGAALVTVLDEGYPRTLRLVFNLPPFLFVRGQIVEEDLRSVAVVGTRQASPEGRAAAAHLAAELAGAGVSVVSGLARGIDTAAHESVLDQGGRTIAVIGTGVTRCYPTENHGLAERIAAAGAVVSQFWPSAPPRPFTFPQRNVTMSGIAQGTVVIEASATSGAKMQARLALQHGKKLFLLRSLVDQHDWARRYAEDRSTTVITRAEDVLAHLADPCAIRDDSVRRVQLSLLESA